MTSDRPSGGPSPRGRRPIHSSGAINREQPQVWALLSKPAIEGTAGIAAPLLAGFSLALVGVIAQDPTRFRWPGVTLAALMVPIFFLLYAVRVGARARGIVDETNYGYNEYDALSRRTIRMYGIGICSLWVCIAMTVAPPLLGGQEVVFRWVAFALAIAASVIEAGWTIFKLRAHALAEATYAELELPS
jgi:hypothetical protein